MSDPRKFLFNSDYPVDKIIWLNEQTVTGSQVGTGFSLTIPHNLGAIPFVRGMWSTDNWDTTYPTPVSTYSGQAAEKYVDVSSDATNVYISGLIIGGTTITIRLWGVFNEADTQDIHVAATAGQSSNKLLFSSDYRYPKLLMEGYADATAQTVTIPHNLGFIPQVDIWTRVNNKWQQVGMITPESLVDVNGVPKLTNIDENTVQFIYVDQFNSGYYYFRIYADEA